ncbi:MAG: imidazole glycerol phosphate synthase subunit HisH [Myxococcota bacterium]
MKAVLFDIGAGNLHSLERALVRFGVSVSVEADATKLTQADLLILPGVGAFGHAAERLAPGRAAVREALEAGLPCIGICLGMQLLFDESEEGPGAGLGLLPGRVTRLRGRRVPHLGWTPVGDDRFYFAHTYACRPVDPAAVEAWAEHEGERFPAIVRKGRTAGAQFHPEKSSKAGLALLERLVREVTS